MKLIGIFLTAILSAKILACTVVAIPASPEKWMGKDFDWHLRHGLLITNKRHVQKQGFPFFPTDRPARWVSKYGSLTFHQYGRELPLEGLNEAGLGVEIMWLDESVYPAVDNRFTVNELQWVQYQLDNYATVAEVLAHIDEIRLSQVFGKVHYMVCDRSGSCATIEFVGGKLAAHSGATMPVTTLANDTYERSLAFLKQHQGFGGDLPIPQSTSSLDRFTRASAWASKYTKDMASPIDFMFDLLHSTDQGTYTMWSIVYQLATSKVSFKTFLNNGRKHVDLAGFDFSCKQPVKIYDVTQAKDGDITHDFVDYTREENSRMVDLGLKEYESQLPPGLKAQLVAYPETMPCLE